MAMPQRDNARSEVTAANVSGVLAAYGYDEICNPTNWTANRLHFWGKDLSGTLQGAGGDLANGASA